VKKNAKSTDMQLKCKKLYLLELVVHLALIAATGEI
jgi:hypothetical protein